MMHIAFCTDTNYIMPAGVAMVSVCENNKNIDINFHLVITDEGTSPDEVDNKVKPLLDIANSYNKQVNVYRISQKRISEFACNGANYISTTAFSRIFLPEILDSSIKKVLYLDCDLVCDGPLTDLWDIELGEDCPFGAIVDSNYASPNIHKIAEIPQDVYYINSGVLLMNLDCWRKNQYIDLCVRVALEKKFPLLDQDLLNHLFYKKIQYLPVKYNLQLPVLIDGPHSLHITLDYFDEIVTSSKKPVIIHYLSENKPWKNEKCPLREVWTKYLNMTIWKGQPLVQVVARFDRTYIYEDILSNYWSDPVVFKNEVSSYMRFFKASVKFKNKSLILKPISFILNCFASVLEYAYRVKTQKKINAMPLERLLWNTKTRNVVLLILSHLPICKGRVMCVCWGGTKYNCNPRAITDNIKDKTVNDSFDITYAFVNPLQFENELPKAFHSVLLGSLRYNYLIATSQFIISNTRFAGGQDWPFKKRKGQYYIQTMHGGHGIKKIEWDTAETLSAAYLETAEKDRVATDLMLSNSKYWSNIYRTAFRYDGEILEKGLPRNDIFLKTQFQPNIKKYLIYTPTFRSNGRKDVYGFDIDKIVSALETRFGGEWYIRISSHPNMSSYYHEIYDFSHPRLIDVGKMDLQPLLVSSDALITDYSSAEMDFSLTKRPVFQLCKDRADYDRGFYINPESLPFPYAETDDQLVSNILNFDNEKYLSELEQFNREVIGLNETGHASEAVVEWMINKLN